MHTADDTKPETSALSDQAAKPPAEQTSNSITVTQTENDALADSSDDADMKPSTIDGGSAAWLVVLGAWCSSFCSYGWINSMYLYFQHITEDTC